MALPSNFRTPAVPPALFGRRASVSTGPPSSHHKTQNVNPFFQGQPGHPAFAAARFARLAESADSANKPIKAPKPPLMPYMRYSKKMWDHVKAANPRIKSIPDIGKMIGKMWQDLTDDERKEYEIEYEMEKLSYQEALQNYHNSSAYQDWLKKEEMRKMQLAQEAEEKKHISSRVGVVQADDDEDNVFSLKHLAAARYQRNHLLMAEIFSDSVIPDMRQVVFGNKLNQLRKQRANLDETLNTRQTEIKKAEDSHDKIRKKILEDRDRWEAQWTETCSKKPKLTDEMFEQLVQRSRQELRDKMRQQQQQAEQQAKNAASTTAANGSSATNPSSVDGAPGDGPIAVKSGISVHSENSNSAHNESSSADPIEPVRAEAVTVTEPAGMVEASGSTASLVSGKTTELAPAGGDSKASMESLSVPTKLDQQASVAEPAAFHGVPEISASGVAGLAMGGPGSSEHDEEGMDDDEEEDMDELEGDCDGDEDDMVEDEMDEEEAMMAADGQQAPSSETDNTGTTQETDDDKA